MTKLIGKISLCDCGMGYRNCVTCKKLHRDEDEQFELRSERVYLKGKYTQMILEPVQSEDGDRRIYPYDHLSG